MTEMVTSGPVPICAQAFGSPGDPAVVLIGGTSSSMDYWEPEFCAALAAGGRFVVRYDLRDTGQSAHDPAGAPAYGARDLALDVLGLLDHWSIERACLMGISAGGGIAQVTALEHPDRVSALVLMSTMAPGGPAFDMDPALLAYFQQVSTPDWSDPDAVVEQQVGYGRALAARSVPFDAAAFRALVRTALGRTADVRAALTNHDLLRDDMPPWFDRLGSIPVPTVVVHGAEDPLMAVGHGEALAQEIPHARLLVLPGVGHEFPRRAWDAVLPAVLEVSGRD